MFQLEPQEFTNLIFQFGASSYGHGGRRKPAYAFTEQGVAMLSSVLHSPRAVSVNIEIMRAFVRIRQWLASNAELARNGAGIRRSVVAGFHSLRHSAVSFLRQAGAAQSVSQAIVGHNSPDVHALYTHTDEDALRRAVATLPAVIGTQAPALPPAKQVDAAPIRAALDKMNAKNWRMVKKNLLATLTPAVLPPAVVGS